MGKSVLESKAANMLEIINSAKRDSSGFLIMLALFATAQIAEAQELQSS